MYLLETFHDGDLIFQGIFTTFEKAIKYLKDKKLAESSCKRSILFIIREQEPGVFMLKSMTLSNKLMRTKLLTCGEYSDINCESALDSAITILSQSYI